MKYLTILMSLLITGCTTVSDEITAYQQKKIEVIERTQYIPETFEGTFHHRVELLARQLFDTSVDLDSEQAIVIGTFLPVNSLKADPSSDFYKIGLQIQESFYTLSTQAGLKVIEHRSLSSIHVKEGSDVMLSRERSGNPTQVNAGYMLTGTYSVQQSSLVVNARLIRVKDKTLVAAATDYMPTNIMWSKSKAQLNNNQIYRGEY